MIAQCQKKNLVPAMIKKASLPTKARTLSTLASKKQFDKGSALFDYFLDIHKREI